MPNRQFVRWRAYFALEPFGPLREDLRAGQVAAMIANTIPRERGSKPFLASDFFATLHEDAPPRRRQTREEQIAALKIWAATAGASAR